MGSLLNFLRHMALGVALCTAAACAGAVRLPAAPMHSLQVRHAGRVVELRSSCYYGDLYDENDLWLLSPYPFASTSHIVTLHGEPVHPNRQRGMLPAGTRFTLERLEFPTRLAMLRRMLISPRFSPWVILRLHDDQPQAVAEAKRFVWVLPDDLQDEAAVQAALDAALAPEGAIQSWLSELRPTMRVAVAHKEAALGMRQAELEAALGPPQRLFSDAEAGRPVRVAWYAEQEIWLRDGEVIAVHPARNLGSASSPATASTASDDG